MNITVSAQMLASLWGAAIEPAGRVGHASMARIVGDVARRGWAAGYHIEDLLYAQGCLSSMISGHDLCEAFGAATQFTFDRPRSATSSVAGHKELRAADLAMLLITLERCGLPVDPEPLVTALIPRIKTQAIVTSAELRCLWFSKERHRFSAITLKIGQSEDAAGGRREVVLPTGYRAVICEAADGSVREITVHAPRERRQRHPSPLRPGTIVRAKFGSTLPRGALGTVVEDHSGSLSVMMDDGLWSVAREEVSKIRDQTPLKVPMRFRLPYGSWTCEDGREVLFNRDYRPIMERYPNGQTKISSGDEWVSFNKEEHFYHDGDSPWSDRNTLERCNSILTAWGFAGWEGEGLPKAASSDGLKVKHPPAHRAPERMQ